MTLTNARARRAVILLALAGIFAALGACQRETDEAFGKRVRTYLLKHPEVLEETIAQLNANRMKVAIDRNRAAIERDPRDFVANPKGKITVTEFFDYNCTYCKAAAPQVLAMIRDNPDIRFVFKEYPVLSADSERAAALAIAAKDSGHYIALHRQFFATEGHLDAGSMRAAAAAAGLDPANLENRALSLQIRQQMVDTHRLAGEIGIEGTPNFVVGDQVIAGGNMDRLMRAINEARRKA